MKLIQQNVELIEQPSYDLDGCYKMIEQAARVCYASEASSVTAEEFVQRLIKSKHLTPLEFGTVYLKYNIAENPFDVPNVVWFQLDKHSVVEHSEDNINYYVTTNFRVLIERGLPIDNYKFVEPDWNFHKKRLTFKFTTSIGIARELNRYRTHSICEQSTRYCNFSKDKFGNELTFIKPYWLADESYSSKIFKNNLLQAEEDYLRLIEEGCKPQEARDVLPLATRSILMHCAYEDDWKHFLDQRYYEKTGKAHPDCKELAQKVYEIYFLPRCS